MAQITKTYRFEAAHQLYGHKGKCAELHGHSYRIDVTLDGLILDETSDPPRHALMTDYGFVTDFGDLDEAVDPLIAALDHTFLNQSMIVPRTTAEFIACWFIWKLQIVAKLPVAHVDVWETQNSFARANIFDINRSLVLRDMWNLGEGPLLLDMQSSNLLGVPDDNGSDNVRPSEVLPSEGR